MIIQSVRVGLVGGLGPESTIDYYRRILESWAEVDPSTAPSIVIDSIDVQLALQLVATDRPALVEYLLGSVRRLAGAGVDFVAITANTPHIVFDELAARSVVKGRTRSVSAIPIKPNSTTAAIIDHSSYRVGKNRVTSVGQTHSVLAHYSPYSPFLFNAQAQQIRPHQETSESERS